MSTVGVCSFYNSRILWKILAKRQSKRDILMVAGRKNYIMNVIIENSDTSDSKAPKSNVCPYRTPLYHLKFELFVSGSQAH